MMARKLFTNPKPTYLTITARREEDQALLAAFRELCEARGSNMRQGILQAMRNELNEYHR